MHSILEAVDRLVEEVFVYLKEHKDASLDEVKKSVLGNILSFSKKEASASQHPSPKCKEEKKYDEGCCGISVVGVEGNVSVIGEEVTIIKRKKKPKEEEKVQPVPPSVVSVVAEVVVSKTVKTTCVEEEATQFDDLETTPLVALEEDNDKEEEDILDIVNPVHKKMSVEEICQPLPACFWRPREPFKSGFGELYCTREEITNCSGGDYIDVILCKNEFGKLEIIGTVFAADLPVLISQSILYGREADRRRMREFFISKILKPSTFEYGCELLIMKGIKFGKFRAY